MVTEIIHESVPLYEKTSVDEFYIDLTGMDRFFGSYRFATELRQRIMRETGLPISFAMSVNKTVSKIGTGEAKPNGQMEIISGTEKKFLAPLAVEKIPMAGEKTCAVLRGMGIHFVHHLQQIKIESLQQVLGEHGVMIWEKANGIDDSPVIPWSERKSISTEQTFEKDTAETDNIKAILVSMAEKLAYQLRSEKKLAACVTVKVRYSDFTTFSRQMKLPYTSLDHVLMEKAKELFDGLYEKGRKVRLVGVRFSNLVKGNYQYHLFEDTSEQLKLYGVMDQLRKRFGSEAIMRAIGMGVRHDEFNPFGRGKNPEQKNKFD